MDIELAQALQDIAVLEKENAELEKRNKQLQDDIKLLTFACENYKEEMENNLADAVKLEKENAELKKQIEKMKCCQNCRFESYDDMGETCRNCSRLLGDIKRKDTFDKWEVTND